MNAATGRALWQLLHAFAMTYPETANDAAKDAALQWLAVWEKIVEENATGCGSCHRKWVLLLERNPPNLSGREAFHDWTIAAHDWINRQLGKPLYDTAISLHYENFGVRLPNG